MKTSGKHVIILGAGASKSSGYPIANALTLLMCDGGMFRRILRQEFEDSGDPNAERFSQNSVITHYFDSLRGTTSLLRNGDFATMDELSRLAAGGKESGTIGLLKK